MGIFKFSFLENHFLYIGCGIGILPTLLFIFYQAYIKEDKVVVFKKPKIIKIEEEKKEEKIVSIW